MGGPLPGFDVTPARLRQRLYPPRHLRLAREEGASLSLRERPAVQPGDAGGARVRILRRVGGVASACSSGTKA